MDLEKLFKDYYSGMNIKKLCKKHGFKGSGSLYYHLRKHSKPNRGKEIPYDNPFIEDSEERDYWLGWIFSDGHVTNGPTHYLVYLACLDKEIIEGFQNFCGDRATYSNFTYITPVSKEKRLMHRATVHSKELANYMYNTYGIAGKKANALDPNIEINWNLLRGVLEGDGSFKKGVVLTSRSKLWIGRIKKFYDKHNVHYTCTFDSAYRLGVYRKEDVITIYNYLYGDTELFLKRKKDDLYRLAMQ